MTEKEKEIFKTEEYINPTNIREKVMEIFGIAEKSGLVTIDEKGTMLGNKVKQAILFGQMIAENMEYGRGGCGNIFRLYGRFRDEDRLMMLELSDGVVDKKIKTVTLMLNVGTSGIRDHIDRMSFGDHGTLDEFDKDTIVSVAKLFGLRK